ncbi:MAG: hypothetical protein ABIT47_04165 [Candidatus Paceibacterota bacterium]
MPKETTGPEFDALRHMLFEAESKMRGTGEEINTRLNQIIIDEGYDPDEVLAALNARNASLLSDLRKNSAVIVIEPLLEEVDKTAFMRRHGRPYYGPL